MNETNALRRILIVDDEQAVLSLIKNNLINIGCIGQIDTVLSGEEAMVVIRDHHYDLMITDLNLPGMDGVSLTDALSAISPDTCVIWITAVLNDELEEKAHAMGVEHFLLKPLDAADIRKIAQEALSETILHQTRQDLKNLSPFGSFQQRIRQLRGELGAHAVLTITKTGHLIDEIGLTQDMDVTSLSALIAANFIAANEIARMMGRDNTFKVSFYESEQFNVYAYGLGSDYLLVTVFGSKTRAGAVWFYTKKAAADLEILLDEMEADPNLSAQVSQDFSDEVEQGMGNILQNIWISSPPKNQSSPDESQDAIEQNAQIIYDAPQQILTYQEALDCHIL